MKIFLEENAGLFAASDKAWKNVKDLQGVTISVRENFVRARDTLSLADKPGLRQRTGRHLRRVHERTLHARDRIMLSTLSNDASDGFKRAIAPALDQMSDQNEQRAYFLQRIEPSIESFKKNLVELGGRGDLIETGLRRFSFQDFPGISGSTIAAKTRLAYSVLYVAGNPTLVVYGIFLKQDIESIDGLPVRA
ncbi:MAG TPA: hypothetical protein VF733_00025 [Candidatus Saccharimonadales bacterium]